MLRRMIHELNAVKAFAKKERLRRLEAEKLLGEFRKALSDRDAELEASATALTSTKTLLYEIMTAAPKGIILCTPDFIIRELNPAGGRKLGGRVEEIIGRSLDEFFPEASKFLSSKGDGEFSLDALKANDLSGSPITVEVQGFAGAFTSEFRYLLLFRDITDKVKEHERQRLFEQQIDEARRLEAIGALAAGIAHEINTPIQFIGDNLDFLKDALKNIHQSYTRYEVLRGAAASDDRYKAEVAEIEAFNQSIVLEKVVGDILSALADSRDGIRQVRDIVLLMKEFAHPGTGENEEADLNAIARNVVTLCRNRRKGIAEIELELTADLPLVKCRRGQIQQVILNILLNALDAVDEAKPPVGRIRIGTAFDNNYIKLSISDNGKGIPDSLRQKIYDPFFTTKPVGKGTGQGLALAKDFIVKGHHGRLGLIDIEGFATTFLIELPLKAVGVRPAMEGASAAA
ncbi:MAG: hypothetical protein A3E78_00225 [Alphaproteobacteria bacterium RIFCSPHIGHO2_12_FULL_63_12]|nr:MAG: hypothetical protein A3E78_00225 [Alphaproteobacteria bacterium RIFCSPHIGHO2_12_FULL_63_12]